MNRSLFPAPGSTPAALAPFVERALAAIGREYPNHLQHLARGDDDVRPPRELTPAFFGSFDWHSAVHGHWCILRGLHAGVEPPLADRAIEALGGSLSHERLAAELAYLAVPERAGFERPYGLAWLLQLAAELRESPDPRAFAWHDALRRLEELAFARIVEWLPRLRWPIRSGEHAQTAFALGLVLDAARAAGADAALELVARRARELYAADRAAPVAYEPSGHDFLSPTLGEADLMRRVLGPAEFECWLWAFLPEPDAPGFATWLAPVESTDRADGKLAHLDGLNLSRAWMLDGIASSLDAADPRTGALAAAAERHLARGVEAALATTHYAGTHWLSSFAMYALTRRGVARD